MKKVIVVLIVLGIIFGVYYFLKSSNKTQQNQTQTTQTSVTPNNNSVSSKTSAQTYKIYILNFAFEPKNLAINKGDTVVWTNNDSVPHQIKGDNLSSLSAPVMNNGQTYSFTFNNIGTFNYHCAIHPSMTGNITVK